MLVVWIAVLMLTSPAGSLTVAGLFLIGFAKCGRSWLSAYRQRRWLRDCGLDTTMTHWSDDPREVGFAEAESIHQVGRAPDSYYRLLDDLRIIGGEEPRY